jgi:kinesin family protein 6/9
VLPSKISFAYQVLREMVQAGGGIGGPDEHKRADQEGGGGGSGAGAGGIDSQMAREEVKKLRMMVQTRDNEISVLVGMLKENPSPSLSSTLGQQQQHQQQQQQHRQPPTLAAIAQRVEQQGGKIQVASGKSRRARVVTVDAPVTESLVNRSAAFEDFRAGYSKKAAMAQNKDALRARYGKAKALGEAVNSTKVRINGLKAAIEQRRVQRGIAALTDASAAEDDVEEARLTEEIETGQRAYRENYLALKKMKAEIDHLQMLLEKNRRQMQQDFELWWGLHQHEYADTRTPTHTHTQEELRSPKLVKREAASASGGAPATSYTGNAQADADIAAFYKMRDSLRQGR